MRCGSVRRSACSSGRASSARLSWPSCSSPRCGAGCSSSKAPFPQCALRRAVRQARAGGEIPKSLVGVVAAGDEEVRRRIPGETVGELRSRISDAMARAARELLTRSEGACPTSRSFLPLPRLSACSARCGASCRASPLSVRRRTRRWRQLRPVSPKSFAATAYGLAAAIPASIGYNGIGAAYGRLGQDMASFVEERALALLARPAEVAREDAPRRRAETP